MFRDKRVTVTCRICGKVVTALPEGGSARLSVCGLVCYVAAQDQDAAEARLRALAVQS